MGEKGRVLLLIGVLLLFPASGEGKGFSLWPLLNLSQEGERVEVQALGPLLFYEKDSQGLRWGIRPLFSFSHTQEGSRYDLLYPLGKYEAREERKKFYLVPLSLRREDPSEGEDFALFPFYWGRTAEGERYGGVFPLYGTLKKRFGKDEIRFLLWPLYVRSEDEGEVTQKFLWPFFQRFSGRAKGYYVWPLYGVASRGKEHRRGYVLWPFYVWRDDGMGTDEPKSTRLYLPLYASVRTSSQRSDLYLPPFFFHRESKEPFRERWEVPWPILAWERGEGVREFKLFPLFRRRDEEERRRRFFLWPLYSYEWDRMGGEEEEVKRILLLSRQQRITWQGGESDYLNLWPLFERYRDTEGEGYLHSLQLLPFHDEGMERNIYPLFWILHHRSCGQQSRTDFLWGLFIAKRSPRKSSFRLAFLLNWEREGEDFSLRFLLGLIGYERRGGRGRMVFFSKP